MNATVKSLAEVKRIITAHGGDNGNEWNPSPADDETFLYSVKCADGTMIKFYAPDAATARKIYEETF